MAVYRDLRVFSITTSRLLANLCLALAFVALAFAALVARAEAAAPNVVIVNIDDMGMGDFSSYGSQFSSTPNIDQLASQGTRFTQFYAGAPICSPSRAALFTGQYAARSGINSYLDNSTSNLNRDNANNLSLEAPSMARTFQDAGYATGHFGKWHLGGGRDVGYIDNPSASTNVSVPRIEQYGYDQVWTQFEGLGNRIINVVDYGGDAAGVTTRPSDFYNGLNSASYSLGTDGGKDQFVYLEREFNANFMVDRAIEFLGNSKQANPDQPVFMNVWLDEVHTPHDPPPALRAKYDALYPDLPEESRNYLAVLEATDTQIGRLVEYIDQQGLGEETLILVTADNGATATNVSNIGSASPSLRGSKGDLFEGGFREPLIARWTGNVTANRVDNETVLWQTDLFPTLTSITGIDAPAGVAFDGEDMSTAVMGTASQTRTTPLYWNMNRGTEYRHTNPDSSGAGANGQEVIAIRSGDMKLLINARGTAPELYDIANDPGETVNLAKQQSGVASALASQALAIRYSTPSRTLPDAVTAIAHLKAEDLASLGDGSAVSSWSDAATGDSFDASVSQGTASARPTLMTGVLNGKAVVSFDGNDSLVSSGSNSLPSPGAGITVFAVAKGDESGDTAERLAQLGDSGGTAGEVVGLDVSTSSTSTSNGGAGFRFNNGASLYDTQLEADAFHIVAWQVDPGKTYADATLYVDGTLPGNIFSGSSNNPTGTVGFTGADLELILGTGRAANGGLLSSDQYTGQLAELIVFNEQLDIGQMNLVASYLSSEYGLEFAYQTEFDIFAVSGLAWVGGDDNFDAQWNEGDGLGGTAASNVHPFAAGDAKLFLGGGGMAHFDATTDLSFGNRINSLSVGTASAGLIVAGTEGAGTLVVDDNVSLTIGSGAAPSSDPATGDLVIGEDGFAGTVTWNSTGLLKVEGKLRIGQGGTGVLEQNGGTITAGDVAGSLKFVAVGNGTGSHGTYLLNEGEFLPGGSSQLRHLRIGDSGAEGIMQVGDGIGIAESAMVASTDDLYVGYQGGTGTLLIHSDGSIQLSGDNAPVFIAQEAGSTGTVIQDGGLFASDGDVTIGSGTGSVGTYEITAGTFSTGNDGAATVTIGRNGGTGLLRVAGSADVVHHGTMVLANGADTTEGRLELVGSAASFEAARLENLASGGNEAISWIADDQGITALTITGTTSTNDVQLQNPTEVSSNSGSQGDGTALDLNLGALAGSQQLTLIDNQTTEAIVGYFENGTSGELYEEGEQIAGSGFVGTVTISYVGGDGNDVVLSLVAGLVGDYNDNGIVDMADYVMWRNHLGATDGSLANRAGDLRGTPVSTADYLVWKQNFGQSLGSLDNGASQVPEPASLCLLVVGAIGAVLMRRRVVVR